MAKSVKKSAAPVAKKSTKVAKSTKTAPKKLTHSEAVQGSNLAAGVPVVEKVAKSTKIVAAKTNKKADAKAATTTRAPNPIMETLIALMLRKEGATIQDFQGVEGFAIPSMAVVKAAQRAGFKAEASKAPGERTVYKASRP